MNQLAAAINTGKHVPINISLRYSAKKGSMFMTRVLDINRGEYSLLGRRKRRGRREEDGKRTSGRGREIPKERK